MANKNFQKKKIQSTRGGNFGKYQEDVGGGASPEARDPQQRAPGVNSDYRKSNNDTMQPRTEDGKFTYKSVNGESINPKYGPSRGKTVNPLLTGGENGVMIDDVETQFANQSGKYWDKYKDKWYTKGGEFVTSGDFKVRVATEAIWDVAKRRYDSVNGEFESESTVFSETKKGRPGKEEQAAKQKAQAKDKEQAVINQNTGGIKIKPGVVLPRSLNPSQPQPGQGTGTTPIVPPQQQPGQQPQADGGTNIAGQLKHTKDELDQARQILAENGVDVTNVTDEQLDNTFDQYFDSNENSDTDTTDNNVVNNTDNNNNNNDDDDDSDDSDTIKKIKNMGFSE